MIGDFAVEDRRSDEGEQVIEDVVELGTILGEDSCQPQEELSELLECSIMDNLSGFPKVQLRIVSKQLKDQVFFTKIQQKNLAVMSAKIY
nr:hypothetical protein HmN_000307700 [Hymenolepis microstoma]